MRLLPFFLFIVAFDSFSQNSIPLKNIHDSLYSIDQGLIIVVDEGSCGLCFEKINSIKESVLGMYNVPIYVVFSSLNLPLEMRSSCINNNKKFVKGKNIQYLFMDQSSKESFRDLVNLDNEPGSPFLICMRKSSDNILVLYYPELFSVNNNEKEIVRKIATFFK